MSFLHKSKVREKVNNAVLKALATTGVIATMPIYATKIDHENFKNCLTEIATIFSRNCVSMSHFHLLFFRY